VSLWNSITQKVVAGFLLNFWGELYVGTRTKYILRVTLDLDAAPGSFMVRIVSRCGI